MSFRHSVDFVEFEKIDRFELGLVASVYRPLELTFCRHSGVVRVIHCDAASQIGLQSRVPYSMALRT